MKNINNEPYLLISIPGGPVDLMNMSWADSWIHIWNNGKVGYDGSRLPTETEKKEIMVRITKLRELIKEYNKNLNTAWDLCGQMEFEFDNY